MTTIQVVESIKADANSVWDVLGDFGGIKVGGPITAFEVTGEGVGAVRRITMGGALIVERLDAYDPDNLTFTYSITNEDCPLPLSGYSSTVKITSTDEGCSVDWTGTFEPNDGAEQQAAETVKGIYVGGIAQARKAVGN